MFSSPVPMSRQAFAANMSGIKNGVQALVKSEAPQALYVNLTITAKCYTYLILETEDD